MRADRRDPTIAAIKKLKGSKYVATLRDGTTQDLVLSTKSNRWELLLDTLEAIPWIAIKVLDESKSLLGVVERDDDYEWEDDDGGGSAMEVERIVKIVMGAVAGAMGETRRMFADVMKAQADMTASLVESVRVLQDTYTTAMQVQRASLMNAPDAAEGNDVMEMVKMAMMLRAGGTPSVSVKPPPPKSAANGSSKG